MKTNASYRLWATSNLNPQQILLSTVQHHLKQNGLRAEFPDDDKNNLVVQGNMAQVLMGMSSLGWSHEKEEEVKGGLYCSGTAVTVQAQQPLRVMQTAIERVTIWPITAGQSTTPQE
jgi:hypothetical protein